MIYCQVSRSSARPPLTVTGHETSHETHRELGSGQAHEPAGQHDTGYKSDPECDPSFDYELRVSGRARRLSLRVEPGRGLIVTIPKGVSRRQVPSFVARNRQWVEAQLAALERNVPAHFRQWPPQRLVLPAVDLVLELSFGTSASPDPAASQVLLSGNAGRVLALHLSSNPAEQPAVVTELTRELKRLATVYFPVRLEMLAKQHGLTFDRVQIRGQRTRWGSCSSRGTISLNFKLLFLSPALVDYVLRHELAHTRHLNHSPAFWRQLVSMQSDAMQMDARLSQCGREIPPWIDLGSG